MIKKKVLWFGEAEDMHIFYRNPFAKEYEIAAIMSYDAEMLDLIPNDNFTKLDIVHPNDVQKFAYGAVDAVLLTSLENRQAKINFLIQRGIEPRRIILWNPIGNIEGISVPQSNGVNIMFMEGLEFHLRDDNDRTFFNQIRTLLQNQKRFFAFDPQGYPGLLTRHYNAAMNHPLQWNNLQTWTEKMQWLKLFDATPFKSRLTDRYLVRYCVAEKIGNEYLTPLLGVWDKFDDIDFDFLPDKFVLKCNHAPNFSIVADKNSLDIRNLREKFTAMMQVDYGAQFTFELHYSAIKRRIIAEKLIEGNAAEYKFLCFNGKPIYCRHADVYYDMDWDAPEFEKPSDIHKPKNFALMKKLARKLCGDFAFVRVDFKEIDGDIYFDALEFTPSAGMLKFKSDAVDKVFGEMLTIVNNPLLPPYNPGDYMVMAQKHSLKLHFVHKDRITFPEIEPCKGRVIIALSSWSKRISTVHLAVQSILKQSRQPDLIVLYLADSEFPNREKDLPEELTALLSDKFEIHWVKEDTRNYKKLKSFEEFSEDIIVHIDDDMMFHEKWLQGMLDGYEKYPSCIQCYMASPMFFNKSGEINIAYNIPYDYPNYLQTPAGWGGILYPPHSIREEDFKREDLLQIASFSNDIWSSMIAALHVFRVNVVETDFQATQAIPNTQDVGITSGNRNENIHLKVLEQIHNVLREYPGLRDILWQEWLNAKPD